MGSFDQFLEIASKDGFQLIEILCEGPYWPRNVLMVNTIDFEIFDSYDIDIFLHSPTIDLNPASLNPGIRQETLLQLKETIDLAAKIESSIVTTHPGMIHRLEERVRNLGMHYSIETLKEVNEYSEEVGINFSVENMPNRYAYFCNSSAEHQLFVDRCGCYATVDLGHANTTANPASFFNINNILYYHVSDNNGKKDQHLTLGEGSLDLEILSGIDKVVIELNDYENVLKSRDLIISFQ